MATTPAKISQTTNIAPGAAAEMTFLCAARYGPRAVQIIELIADNDEGRAFLADLKDRIGAITDQIVTEPIGGTGPIGLGRGVEKLRILIPRR